MPTWIKHGYRPEGKKTRIYRCWGSMRERCNNPKHPAYDRYGGRGITVCERWNDFVSFLADMGAPPKGWSIERVDNAKGYSVENCVWATRIQQARNKRNNKLITFNGKTACVAEFADIYHLPRKCLELRLRHGWTVERALLQPLQVHQGCAGSRGAA